MNAKKDAQGGLGFVDGFLSRFRRARETPEPEQAAGPSPEDRRQQFDAALKGLDQKIEEHRRRDEEAGRGRVRGEKTSEQRAAERAQRRTAAHQAIREDVVAMHARLGTGLGDEDLTQLGAFLEEIEAVAAPGVDSHELLPRARYGIAKRFGREAGELAVARLRQVLEAAEMKWPDPIAYHPSTKAEDLEAARKRRFSEMREQFLARGMKRTAERLVGVVGAWGSDYPERDSPLWQETVLEAIAAGLQAELLREFVERTRADRGLIETEADRLVGPELAALQEVLGTGVGSVEEATEAVARALSVIDEVIPDLAWQHLCEVLPRARGEW